jgi:hypothetical protein
MVREESDDIIATLEQENRQLHARNQRLEQELEIANNNGIDELRNKLHMEDQDKFESFRTSVKALAKCFEDGNQGLLVADIGNKVSIMGINAGMKDVVIMATAAATKVMEVIDDIEDEDRVLN